MKYCSKCGSPLEEDAAYCENCGHKRGSRTMGSPIVQRGEIVHSTKLLTSQQLLLMAIMFVGGGLMIMLMTAFIPDDPFFDDSRGMTTLMGLASMGIGLAIFVLGNWNLERH